MIKETLVFIYFLFLSVISQGQEQGQLIARPKPSHAIIRLDTTLLKPLQIYNLTPGSYILKSWAPNYNLYIDTIQITTNKTTRGDIKLKRTKEYIKFRKHRFTQYSGFALNGIILLALNKNRLNMINKQDYYKTVASEYQRLYLSAISPEELVLYKNNYDYYIDKFKTSRDKKNLATLTTISAGVVGTTLAYFIYKKQRAVRPKVTPLLSSVYPAYDPITNTYHINASILIK